VRKNTWQRQGWMSHNGKRKPEIGPVSHFTLADRSRLRRERMLVQMRDSQRRMRIATFPPDDPNCSDDRDQPDGLGSACSAAPPVLSYFPERRRLQ